MGIRTTVGARIPRQIRTQSKQNIHHWKRRRMTLRIGDTGHALSYPLIGDPQLAARLLVPLGRWRRQDAGRQGLMKAALERILAVEGLSPNVYEIASKSLA